MLGQGLGSDVGTGGGYRVGVYLERGSNQLELGSVLEHSVGGYGEDLGEIVTYIAWG